jgi:hypothetical protein
MFILLSCILPFWPTLILIFLNLISTHLLMVYCIKLALSKVLIHYQFLLIIILVLSFRVPIPKYLFIAKIIVFLNKNKKDPLLCFWSLLMNLKNYCFKLDKLKSFKLFITEEIVNELILSNFKLEEHVLINLFKATYFNPFFIN